MTNELPFYDLIQLGYHADPEFAALVDLMSESSKDKRKEILQNYQFVSDASDLIGMDKDFFAVVLSEISSLVGQFHERLPLLLRAPVDLGAIDRVKYGFNVGDDGRRQVLH